MATLVAASEEAIAAGDYQLLLQGASGPSGARLLGRFCHADEQLRRHVQRHLRAEEALRPDALFAEIVHLPEGRVGNILFRPVLRGHELPFLGRSGAAEARQLPVTDLLVSVAGERVVLRSRRLDREVIPRLTSAHNYGQRSLGIYRFLCSLQDQGLTPGVGWSWGALREAPFLPRVTAGRLVLSRAAWNLAARELRPLAGASFPAVQELRRRLGWPRWIALAEHDNELPVDLDNALCVETFAHLIGRRPSARVVELFPPPDQQCARGPEGRFVHELVVPFVARNPSTRPRPPAAGPPAARRTFAPGSEWLYLKLYTGTSTADQVLTELVRPVVDEAMGAAHADGWFFIRYGDPDWHLRLRLHGAPEALHAEVLPRLQQATRPLLEDGRLWRVQLDTYERELTRYGGTVESMELCERIFCADSEAVLAIVEGLQGDEGLDARWRLTLLGAHLLLEDLGLDLARRLEVTRRSRAGFGREFRVDVDLKRQLGGKYRAEAAGLTALLAGELDDDPLLAGGIAALRARSERLRTLVAEAGDAPLEALAPSLVHMHANRLLRSAARAQELVIHDFLLRQYRTRAARSS
jgi:thiopeptide-type bacteriocin biosynthesis protein